MCFGIIDSLHRKDMHPEPSEPSMLASLVFASCLTQSISKWDAPNASQCCFAKKHAKKQSCKLGSELLVDEPRTMRSFAHLLRFQNRRNPLRMETSISIGRKHLRPVMTTMMKNGKVQISN